ncbi:ParB/RepB/Spo0J family partition protein [Paludisphaera borealis]|uniref:Putative plasmid stabilization protein n=1 Tax=Paludisphaera borealis TaxID=1387353 RepID=A0A1U7CZH5_9BACT|nr:ParB/RepB/Spo0J family partition protein [Paludisphaera borealis]APW64293.1 putative plasmid stabilization protein [Paludisphaera borealis]
MNYQSIEINKLVKSRFNARRTVAKGAADDLKASILAHGLMQNLVVTAAGDGGFEVIEGARRLEAIKALQAEGSLPADYAVSCHVVEEGDAMEKSLAANTVRLAMHPADEYEAFAKLEAGGSSPEQIAERFGKTVKYVEQLLRLGNADPKLLKAYREGGLSLDALMAYAITDDRKRQMKVFKSLGDHQRANPRAIRRALTDAMAEADGQLAKFVGLEAYREAGGTIQSDLFSDAVYLENPELLNDLATAKLDGVKQQLEAEGWGWVEVSPEYDYGVISACGRIQQQPGEAPAEVIALKNQLIAELEEIEQALEDTESDALLEAQEAAEARLAEVQATMAGFAAYDPHQMAFAGCYVTVGHDGSLRTDKGLVRKADKKRLASPTEATERKPKGMPATLKRQLEAYRQQAAQAEIARNRLVALDLLVFTIASDAFGHRFAANSCLGVKFDLQRPAVKEETPAGASMAAIEQGLPLAWLELSSEAERFRALSDLSDNQKLDLLAACVASSLKPQLATGFEATACELALSLTGADLSGYWRPTAANYLGRITTQQLLALGGGLLGEAWAQARSRDKKSELVAQLERVFAEPEKYGRTQKQVAGISQWLPEGMAFTAVTPEKPKSKGKARKAA